LRQGKNQIPIHQEKCRGRALWRSARRNWSRQSSRILFLGTDRGVGTKAWRRGVEKGPGRDRYQEGGTVRLRHLHAVVGSLCKHRCRKGRKEGRNVLKGKEMKYALKAKRGEGRAGALQIERVQLAGVCIEKKRAGPRPRESKECSTKIHCCKKKIESGGPKSLRGGGKIDEKRCS